MLTEHQCHMIACDWLDAEFEALYEGKRTYEDYSPITWYVSRITKELKLIRVQPYVA